MKAGRFLQPDPALFVDGPYVAVPANRAGEVMRLILVLPVLMLAASCAGPGALRSVDECRVVSADPGLSGARVSIMATIKSDGYHREYITSPNCPGVVMWIETNDKSRQRELVESILSDISIRSRSGIDVQLRAELVGELGFRDGFAVFLIESIVPKK